MLVHELRDRLASLADDAPVVMHAAHGEIVYAQPVEGVRVGTFSPSRRAFRPESDIPPRGEADDTTRAVCIR